MPAHGLRQEAVRGDGEAGGGGAQVPRRGQAQRQAHLLPEETLRPGQHHPAGGFYFKK